jgi:hypothetical protein
MNECITCALFLELDNVSQTFARDSYEAIAPWTKKAFGVFTGVWMAWQFIRMYLGEADLKEIGKQALIFVFVGAILGTSDFYFDWFYDPLRTVMSTLTQMVVSVPSTGVEDGELVTLVERVESEMMKVIEFAGDVMSSGGWFDTFGIVVIMVLFVVPFVFVWLIFLAFLLEGAFKLLGVTALGPPLIALSAFKATRGFSMSALRIAINGVMTVVFAGVAMGFTLMVLETNISDLPINAQGDFTGDADRFIFSRPFFAILIVGMLSILFHLNPHNSLSR